MERHPKNTSMHPKNTTLRRKSDIAAPSQRNWRPNVEDWKLIQELRAKLGVTEPDIIRMGIRKLAESEGLR